MSVIMPSTFTCGQSKARKPHQCCECGGRIQQGEVYERVWGVWEGVPATYKTCTDCVSLRAQFNAGRDVDEMVGYGGLLDEVINSGEDEEIDKWNTICRKRKGTKEVIR